MKRLDSYEVLNNEVFYRGMHILDYLYSNKGISELDIEAIKATLMCALVERNLIDPKLEFLNLKKMIITNSFDSECYIYDPNPFVQSFPLWMKEELRKHSLYITGSIPVSVHVARPAGSVHYCVYDANTSLSVIFENFAFIIADYDSPTRIGKRAVDRPFLEADINGVTYLFDVLTKRMFNKNEFMKRYNMEIKNCIKKSEFDDEQTALYKEHTTEQTTCYGSYLHLTSSIFKELHGLPKFQEFFYELEKSREFYPEAFDDVEVIEKEIRKIKM